MNLSRVPPNSKIASEASEKNSVRKRATSGGSMVWQRVVKPTMSANITETSRVS